ncbi:phosphodiesterase [Methylobacterium frigidaeris]|uniref:Phosphodiesterase n=1 Tax=Methylobacterium frigidaeris TaxID=2038277 RepID=A0AA37M772_9HYPH|nr:phosphodiesterase [Methylobacterium frigidaeris]GJD64271.1 hypothetical protein MPEAHAMD_4452 [Methylobacterium frigidaeris]
MNIISHRGLWLDGAEKNSAAAFLRTRDQGFGTETDVRDAGGRLVVSHDPPTGPAMLWHEAVALFSGTGLPLAVNVKADGLADMLREAFAGTDVSWFAFDMSAPEMVRYRRAGLPYYTRHSDVEPDPILYDKAQGVWLDAFDGAWFDNSHVERHLRAGKSVCVVSPELHGRDPAGLWEQLARLRTQPALTLCTDQPIAAREYFAI